MSMLGTRALAQEGTLRIFVGFPPGGLPDLLARAVQRSFDGTTVVENRVGANGRLAAQQVKNAAPDGRTLLLVPASAMVHLPHVYDNLGYNPFQDFVPVAQLVENDFCLGIGAKIPAQNLKEFAAWARKNPDRASYGSPGLGSSPHFMGVTLAKALGIPFIHAPYKGANLAVNDINGGVLAGLFAATSLFVPLAKAGQLRVLATTGPTRNVALPQVPTFRELGMDQLTITEGSWLFAPAKTPQAIVDKLAAQAISSLKSPEMQTIIPNMATAAPLGSREVAALMRREYDQRGAAIRAAGFSANQ
jgi:tripartite-type tricarboxylate transporter receptor subunit TctC